MKENHPDIVGDAVRLQELNAAMIFLWSMSIIISFHLMIAKFQSSFPLSCILITLR